MSAVKVILDMDALSKATTPFLKNIGKSLSEDKEAHPFRTGNLFNTQKYYLRKENGSQVLSVIYVDYVKYVYGVKVKSRLKSKQRWIEKHIKRKYGLNTTMHFKEY